MARIPYTFRAEQEFDTSCLLDSLSGFASMPLIVCMIDWDSCHVARNERPHSSIFYSQGKTYTSVSLTPV